MNDQEIIDRLDDDARKDYQQREVRGFNGLRMTWGETSPQGDERETAACDAISDILTHVVGMAGHYTWRDGETATLHPNEYNLNEARRIIERAFESWVGDAEDYVISED